MRSELWASRLFDRSTYRSDAEEHQNACAMVAQAEARWRQALARYNPEGVDLYKAKAAMEVAMHAKEHLLSGFE